MNKGSDLFAGAMLYVVVEELIPENVAGTALQRWHGIFAVASSVMVLDVALG